MSKVYDAETMDEMVSKLDAFAHEYGVSFVGIIRCFFNDGDGARATSIAVALGEGLCGSSKAVVEAALRHTGEVLIEDAAEISTHVADTVKAVVH